MKPVLGVGFVVATSLNVQWLRVATVATYMEKRYVVDVCGNVDNLIFITNKIKLILTMVTIYDTDDSLETARKIFDEFELHQSVRIEGFETDKDGKLAKKGAIVLMKLQAMWNKKYTSAKMSGRNNGIKPCFRRKKNEVGGYDHMIKFTFKWSEVTEHRLTIMRTG